MLRNDALTWGLVSRAIHWLMAVSILGMLVFGVYIGHFMHFAPDNLWVYQIHKSIGVTLLVLVLARIVWHRISPPPQPLPAPAWQNLAAKMTHLALYALLLIVPLTGWIASAASGFPTVIWGVTIPQIVPTSRPLEIAMFTAHAWVTRALMALLVLHIGGALTHRGALARMIGQRGA